MVSSSASGGLGGVRNTPCSRGHNPGSGNSASTGIAQTTALPLPPALNWYARRIKPGRSRSDVNGTKTVVGSTGEIDHPFGSCSKRSVSRPGLVFRVSSRARANVVSSVTFETVQRGVVEFDTAYELKRHNSCRSTQLRNSPPLFSGPASIAGPFQSPASQRKCRGDVALRAQTNGVRV